MAEEFKPTLCIVCLNVKTDENCTAVEESIRNALDVILLKLPTEEADKSMICDVCYSKVFEAFRFKTSCMDNEKIIFPYINSGSGAPVDLLEIYLKEKGEEQSQTELENERICRLCMQICTHAFTSVEGLESDLTCKFIPEMNFASTKEPVICLPCLDSLKTHTHFLKNCSNVQDNLTISEDKESPFFIKIEEIEIKSEEHEVGIANELDLDIKTIQEVSPPSMSLEQSFNDDNDFQNPPSKFSYGGKNMALDKKQRCSPSLGSPFVRSPPPTPSNSSTSAAEENWLTLINEELQKRMEFKQRVNGGQAEIQKKIQRTTNLISHIKGEKKSVREHREALREQLRALDERELSLDRRERSAKKLMKRYEIVAAKFNEIIN